ncbi:MAG TPA: hypothetical protein VEK08_24815 [Planctomycetota bacterium]|nr:hypothetical protein [Planctomycetota bacterium]
MRLNLLLISPALLLPCLLQADTIIMKTGLTMDGKVISQDDEAYEVEVEKGTVRVLKDKVSRIEEDTPEMIAEKKEKEEAEKELAAQMKEEGKVKYKGKWVTADEKKKDEEKVALARKKKAEAAAEAKKKAEAAAAKKKEEEQKRLAEQQQQRDRQTAYNDDYDMRGDRFGQRHSGRNSRSNRYNDNNYGGNSYGNNYSGRNSGNYGRNSGNYGRYGSGFQSTGGVNANDIQNIMRNYGGRGR